MTKQEFSEAVKIATSAKNLSHIDDSILYGCGLSEFNYPVYVTLETVAKIVRWQCCSIFSNSTIADSHELDNMAHIAKKKFQIV